MTWDATMKSNGWVELFQSLDACRYARWLV